MERRFLALVKSNSSKQDRPSKPVKVWGSDIMSDNDKVNTGHHIEDKELIKNARKPVGELGHQILDRMNESHESMAQWGVTHFEIQKDSKILDIGCGGGRNMHRTVPRAHVVGVDPRLERQGSAGKTGSSGMD